MVKQVHNINENKLFYERLLIPKGRSYVDNHGYGSARRKSLGQDHCAQYSSTNETSGDGSLLLIPRSLHNLKIVKQWGRIQVPAWTQATKNSRH